MYDQRMRAIPQSPQDRDIGQEPSIWNQRVFRTEALFNTRAMLVSTFAEFSAVIPGDLGKLCNLQGVKFVSRWPGLRRPPPRARAWPKYGLKPISWRRHPIAMHRNHTAYDVDGKVYFIIFMRALASSGASLQDLDVSRAGECQLEPDFFGPDLSDQIRKLVPRLRLLQSLRLDFHDKLANKASFNRVPYD